MSYLELQLANQLAKGIFGNFEAFPTKNSSCLNIQLIANQPFISLVVSNIYRLSSTLLGGSDHPIWRLYIFFGWVGSTTSGYIWMGHISIPVSSVGHPAHRTDGVVELTFEIPAAEGSEPPLFRRESSSSPASGESVVFSPEEKKSAQTAAKPKLRPAARVQCCDFVTCGVFFCFKKTHRSNRSCAFGCAKKPPWCWSLGETTRNRWSEIRDWEVFFIFFLFQLPIQRIPWGRTVSGMNLPTCSWLILDGFHGCVNIPDRSAASPWILSFGSDLMNKFPSVSGQQLGPNW